MPRRLFGFILIFGLLLTSACSTPRATQIPDGSQTAATASATGSSSSTAEPTTAPSSTQPAQIQALVDNVLALRLVRITIDSALPGSSSRLVIAEIDDAGNVHLNKKVGGEMPGSYPEAVNPPADTTDLYVVGGKAYAPDATGAIIPADGLENELSQQLNSIYGPGLWLKVLPQGSFTLDGNEYKGGFETKRYAVKGDIEGSVIRGAIWVDPVSKTLVAVRLTVPAALLTNPSAPSSNTLVISFLVEKMEVAPITVTQTGSGTTPSASAATTETAQAGPIAIDKTYPLPLLHLASQSKIVYAGGKVWAGNINGMIDAFDPKTGALLKTIHLRSGASSTALLPVSNMIFDGTYIWVINMDQTDVMHITDTFSIIDPANGDIVKQWDIKDETQWVNLGDPSLGMAPGKIWAMGNIIDAETFELVDQYEPLDMHNNLAYDENGWMWITGHTAEIAGVITFNASDPDTVRVDGDNIDSSGTGSLLCLAGDRMWIASSDSVQAFTANGAKFDTGIKPLADQTLEYAEPLAMVFDGNNLWLLKRGDQRSLLYQMDPFTGEVLNTLDVTGATGGMTPDLPQDLTFDGEDLWLLSVLSFSRITFE